MNNTLGSEKHRSLQILTELAGNDSLTQRDLSRRLGIALGLVNSYIKNLMSKGFITDKAIPPRRYAYFLTPKGFAEKAHLTYNLLQDYTRIYREARTNFKLLFAGLEAEGARTVIFAGADEVAEIAFLTLQETALELAGVVDEEKAGETFFGRHIEPINSVHSLNYDRIVVASYLKREEIYNTLLNGNVSKENIEMIFK